MYELKKIGKVYTSKFVGNGPSSYEKKICRAAVSQRMRNIAVDNHARSIGQGKETTFRIITCTQAEGGLVEHSL